MTTETFYTADDKIEIEYSATSSDYCGTKEWTIEIHGVTIMNAAFDLKKLPAFFVDEIKDLIREGL